ncbi:hypothetical protein ACTXT7_009368 [Hymenolepis weldensis]
MTPYKALLLRTLEGAVEGMPNTRFSFLISSVPRRNPEYLEVTETVQFGVESKNEKRNSGKRLKSTRRFIVNKEDKIEPRFEKTEISLKVLLELARLIFADQSDISRLIYTILMHSQSLLTCQRCQILLVNDLKDVALESDVFVEAYDYTWKDQESEFDEILQRKHGIKEIKFLIVGAIDIG